MAEDSDGTLTAVVICEGNLHDPDFPDKLNEIVGKLQSLVDEESEASKLKVNKVCTNHDILCSFFFGIN
jgi:hypothetical protein